MEPCHSWNVKLLYGASSIICFISYHKINTFIVCDWLVFLYYYYHFWIFILLLIFPFSIICSIKIVLSLEANKMRRCFYHSQPSSHLNQWICREALIRLDHSHLSSTLWFCVDHIKFNLQFRVEGGLGLNNYCLVELIGTIQAYLPLPPH